MTEALHLRRLDGSAAGARFPIHRSLVTLGRHPSADIRFDTPTDHAVADRHTVLLRDGVAWLVRDLGSGAPTLVNGVRITGDHLLRPGDQLQLGDGGPILGIEFVDLPSGSGSTAAGRKTGGRQTPLLWLAMVLTAAGAGWLAWSAAAPGREDMIRRGELLQRIDSMDAALRGAMAREAELTRRLAEATLGAESARVAIQAPRSDGQPTLDSLSALVQRLAERQAPLVRAAQLDLETLARDHRDAVALVLAERADRSVVSGTGFAVASVADTSWLATSRHIVTDSSGGAALRLGVLFDGTAQNFRATIESVHPDFDVALLRVVVRGGTPVVPALAGLEPVGAPVATLSFPLGLDLAPAAAWRREGVTATAFRATVTVSEPRLLQLDGYGAEGMSGSPLFNSDGAVVGVISGGAVGSNGRVVFAVPAERVRELLRGR